MIAYGDIGAATASTSTTNTVAAPSSQGVTDQNFLVVQVKPTTVNATTPTGWTKVAEHTNGTVATAEDVGSVKLIVYRRQGVTGSADVNLDSAPNFFQAVMFSFTKEVGDSWLIDYALATDATNGANYSATSATNFGAEADDILVALTGVNSDGGTLSAETITATGLTLGATTSRASLASSTGDDGRLMVFEASVTSGTQSAGAAFTYSNASATSGTTIILRLKAATATIEVDPLTPLGISAGYTVTASNIDDYDQFQITRIEVSGRFDEEDLRGGALQSVDGRSAVVCNDYEFHWTDKNAVSCVYRDDLKLYKNGDLQDTVSSDEYTPEYDRQLQDGFEYLKYPVTWIKDVNTPILSQPVTLESLTGFQRSGRVLGKHDVIGKKLPVIITDVTSGMTGEMSILVHADPDWTHGFGTADYDYKLRELFDEGSTYYFQTVAPMFSGIEDFYFIVESISVERRSSANVQNGMPITVWTIQFTEVERPPTLDTSVGGGTWSDVNDTYATWRENSSANASWLEMFQKLSG